MTEPRRRRRIPSWVVVVLFAVAVGTAIGGLAYLRRPARTSATYCLQRTPPLPLTAPLVEYGSVRTATACELRFRPSRAADAPVQLVIVSDRRKPWKSRLTGPVVPFREGDAEGVSLERERELVLVMPGTAGEAIEIRLARDADLPAKRAYEIAADIAARLR